MKINRLHMAMLAALSIGYLTFVSWKIRLPRRA